MRDVVEMARRAGAVFPLDGSYHTFERREDLEAFANLVRADEREAERERICQAIKEEDDYCVTEGDYMLDSDDCIAVAKGVWVRPVGDDWTPCMKLPVVVHVRQQRPGESHVSTREGITPVKPDDLIMRGVSGEEYPIGRAIFEQTYTLDTTPPSAPTVQEAMAAIDTLKFLGYTYHGGEKWKPPLGAAPVQKGWKLVPVVATREIEDAIGKARNLKASEIWEDALAATPPAAPVQKRPPNCGTGYCSCVECVMEPAAQPAQQEPINVAQAYAMAQVCLDLHDALGCKWGDNPYLAIDRLKTAAPVPLKDELIGKAWAVADGEHNASASVKRRITRSIETAHGITKGN